MGYTATRDARLKEVVAVLPTGAGSHMAAVTPDDSAVWTAAIGARQMVEIPLDLDASEPTFAVGRVLSVPELLAPIEEDNADWRPFPAPEPDPGSFAYASYAPVCHQYSPDSTEAWITLGPGWAQGGLFVLDLDGGRSPRRGTRPTCTPTAASRSPRTGRSRTGAESWCLTRTPPVSGM